MKRLIFAAGIAMCIFMFMCACKKEKTLTVPATLADTEWTQFSYGPKEATAVMIFDGKTCRLRILGTGSEAGETLSFDYTYAKPKLRLTPTDGSSSPVEAEAVTDGKSYVGLEFPDSGTTPNGMYWLNTGDSVWKK